MYCAITAACAPGSGWVGLEFGKTPAGPSTVSPNGSLSLIRIT